MWRVRGAQGDAVKRVGLLAGLLVLVLGSGVVAQDPSPEATTLYAPDDLASLLPSQLGGSELTTQAHTGDRWLPFFGDDEFVIFDGLLVAHGAEPSDLRTAWASTPDETAPEWYGVFIFRVDGVPADLLHELYMRSVSHMTDDQTFPPYGIEPARTVGGRKVLTNESDEDTSWLFFYPDGEVLFGVNGYGDLSLAEAVAELP